MRRLRPRSLRFGLRNYQISNGEPLRHISNGVPCRQSTLALQLEDELAEQEGVKRSEPALFPGSRSHYTTELSVLTPLVDSLPPIVPTFRILDDIGRVVPGAEPFVPKMSDEQALGIMTTMLRLSEFDKVFLDAQRQGRISFYLTSRGEEACTVGSAAALENEDWILPQYRELGAALWRGLSFGQVASHLCATHADAAHGRQMPVMYGDISRRYFCVKGSLGTHLPHAAGAAYARRLSGDREVTIAYFGDGCASTGDAPSALLIAAVHGCPTLFFCRNNGYAISTSAADQYASDGVAPRGYAYGMPVMRVDGNDLLAVLAATRHARNLALSQKRPVLVEAMTYRLGAHSTSDDDTKYRNPASPVEGWDSERAYWEARSPIIRFGRYLHSRGLWSVDEEDRLRASARREAIEALMVAEREKKPESKNLFSDVYDDEPWNLAAQREELDDLMSRYPQEVSWPPRE